MIIQLEHAKMKIINYGWLLSGICWLICVLSVPLFYRYPPATLQHNVHDYYFGGIIAKYAMSLLASWIFVGVWAGNAYNKRGIRRAALIIVLSFFVILIFLYNYVGFFTSF